MIVGQSVDGWTATQFGNWAATSDIGTEGRMATIFGRELGSDGVAAFAKVKTMVAAA